jgi:hypothetical protein
VSCSERTVAPTARMSHLEVGASMLPPCIVAGMTAGSEDSEDEVPLLAPQLGTCWNLKSKSVGAPT